MAALGAIRDPRVKEEVAIYGNLFPGDRFKNWQYFPSILKRLQRSSLTAAITAADAAGSAPLPPPVAKPKGTPAMPITLPDGTVQVGLGPGGALSKKQIAAAKNPPAQQPPPQQQQQQQRQQPNPASQPNPKTTTGAGTGKALTFVTKSGVPMTPAQIHNHLTTLTRDAALALEAVSANPLVPGGSTKGGGKGKDKGKGKDEQKPYNNLQPHRQH